MAIEQDANRAKDIGLNAPNEGIDAASSGRFYPHDYSGEINAYTHQRDSLAKVPEYLANIVANMDDYRISLFSDEERVKIQKDYTYDNIVLGMQEARFQRENLNNVFEQGVKMRSDLASAMEQASNEGTSQLGAVQDVLLENKELPTEVSTPYASQVWQNRFSEMGSQYLAEAQQKDINTEHFRQKNNMAYSASQWGQEVLTGRKGPVDAIAGYMKDVAPYSNFISAEEAQRDRISNYNRYVSEYATWIKHSVEQHLDDESKGMTIEQGQNLLSQMLNNSNQSLAFYDKNGEVVKDDKGNPVLVKLGLEEQTQKELLALFDILGNKGLASGGSVDLDNVVNEFKQWIGYSTIEEKGYSPEMLGKDVTEIRGEAKKAFDYISSSGAKPEAKTKAIKSLVEAAASVDMITGLRDMLDKNPDLAGYIIKKASEDLNAVLRGEGNANVDWSKFQLSIPNKEGGAFTFGTSISNWGLPHNLDGQVSYQLYWEAMNKKLAHFSELAASGDIPEVFSELNSAYRERQTDLASAVTKNDLVSFSGDEASINSTGVSNLISKLSGHKNLASSMGIPSSLSDSTFRSISDSLGNPANGFTTDKQKFVAACSIGEALTKSGLGGDAFTFLIRHSKADDQYNESAKAIAEGVLLASNPSKQKELIKLRTGVYASPDTRKNAIEMMKQAPGGSIYEENLNKQLTSMNIPQTYRPALLAIGEDLCVSANQQGKSVGEASGSGFKSFLKSNFITLPKSARIKDNVSVYKHSSVFNGWSSPEAAASALEEANGLMHTWAPGVNVSWSPNEESGTIDLLVNGKPLAGVVNGATIGRSSVSLFNPSSYGFSGNDDTVKKAMSQCTALYAFTVMASRDNILQNRLNVPDRYTKEPGSRIAGVQNTLRMDLSDKEIKKELFSLASALGNPRIIKEVVKGQIVKNGKSLGSKVGNGALQNASFLNIVRNPNMNSHMLLFSNLLPTANKGGGSLEDNIILQVLRANSRLKRQERGMSSSTGGAAGIDPSLLMEISSRTSYAGKVDQADISVPLSFAAIGEEKYMDIYNTAASQGYEITGAYIPGVTMNEEGMPTGYAANLTGSRDQVPTARAGYSYTKDEMKKMVDHYADMWGVPRNVAHALVMQESGYQQKIGSSVGARGVTQLMPATAKSLGVTDINDAGQNIWGGMKYMSQMMDMFGGSIPLSLAAYNAGPGAVGKAKGIPNIPETKRYVQNILKRSGYIDDGTYPVTFALRSNQRNFIDSDTGMLSYGKMNDFMYLINNGEGYKGNVKHIVTNRPELLENSPRYADFKKFREMKSGDGKPLFVKGNYDGFKVMVKRGSKYAQGKGLTIASGALADDAVRTQSSVLPQVSSNDMEALINSFSGFKGDRNSSVFGLANLDKQSYKNYGVPEEMINNPVMQSRVLCQEFQRAIDLLGSPRKAVYALAGGEVKNDKNEVKTWAEVKQDKEAFRKNWFIYPSDDKIIRERANSILANYENNYRRIRGY